MIAIDGVRYRVLHLLSADGWQACYEVDGRVVCADLVAWATLEAVAQYHPKEDEWRAVSATNATVDFSRVVGMHVSDGIIDAVEGASNFLGYCYGHDSDAYEEEAKRAALRRLPPMAADAADAATTVASPVSQDAERGAHRLLLATLRAKVKALEEVALNLFDDIVGHPDFDIHRDVGTIPVSDYYAASLAVALFSVEPKTEPVS